MNYDYVRRMYGADPIVGQRARHTVTNREGEIRPEKPGEGHYVQVRFDGDRLPLPCHPTELEYLEATS